MLDLHPYFHRSFILKFNLVVFNDMLLKSCFICGHMSSYFPFVLFFFCFIKHFVWHVGIKDAPTHKV